MNFKHFLIFLILLSHTLTKLPNETKELIAGELLDLVPTLPEDNSKLIWTSTAPQYAIVNKGRVLALQEGQTTITATNLEGTVILSLDIIVLKYISPTEPDDVKDEEEIKNILKNMTLKQKIGQMFCVGFTGTNFDPELEEAIEQYNFGNIIYMGENVADPSTLSDLSNNIQRKMIECNSVPALISTDQEGGKVARLYRGATRFLGNMAMGGTGDFENTYKEGEAVGEELIHYGINVNLAPVFDTNNNPENIALGVRSYSDNPIDVLQYGLNMYEGMKSKRVMGTLKHYPGAGNTTEDSHFDLPTVDIPIDKLYQIEFAPFIGGVYGGVDAIMTTHIIFSDLDKEYPATLSEAVITGLLRNRTGFDGIIFTDGMEMDAIDEHYGTYDVAAVLAVKAGVDILLYTSNGNPRIAYEGVYNAVTNETAEIRISEERINESVRRILRKKQKYGVLHDYEAKKDDITELLERNKKLNNDFAESSLTQVIGEFKGLDKSKKTIIISTASAFNLEPGLASEQLVDAYSFGNFACDYLIQKGLKSCSYKTIKSGSDITLEEYEQLLLDVKDNEQIVLAFKDVKTQGYTNIAKFVDEVALIDPNVVYIAFQEPYDILSFKNVITNYICVYTCQRESAVTLTKYLNGELQSKGQLPVRIPQMTDIVKIEFTEQCSHTNIPQQFNIISYYGFNTVLSKSINVSLRSISHEGNENEVNYLCEFKSTNNENNINEKTLIQSTCNVVDDISNPIYGTYNIKPIDGFKEDEKVYYFYLGKGTDNTFKLAEYVDIDPTQQKQNQVVNSNSTDQNAFEVVFPHKVREIPTFYTNVTMVSEIKCELQNEGMIAKCVPTIDIMEYTKEYEIYYVSGCDTQAKSTGIKVTFSGGFYIGLSIISALLVLLF